MGVAKVYDDGLSILKNPTIVTTAEGARKVAQTVYGQKKLSFDIEATSLYFREARHHGVAIATPEQEWYVSYNSHPHFYKEAARLKLFTNKWWFMHNAAYDMPFILRYIPGIQVKVFDTFLAQHTIDENQLLGLKPLAQNKLGAPKNLADFAELQKDAARICDVRGHTKMRVTDFKFEDLAMYAMRDVRYTLDLGEVSVKELRNLQLWDVYLESVLDVFPLILEMDDAGVFIDQENLAVISVEYKAKLAELTDKWNSLTGNVNPRSNKEMPVLLYETLGLPIIKTTKSGAPSCASDTIKRLIDRENITDPDHPLSVFVEISKMQTLVNVVESMEYSVEENGRVYSRYNQVGAKTGRMSCSGAKDIHGNNKGLNAQNVPSHSPEAARIRACWSTPPGRVMGVYDYSQLELRIGGDYMAKYLVNVLHRKGITEYRTRKQRNNRTLQVPKYGHLMQTFLDGKDPHMTTAEAIFLNEMEPEERAALTKDQIKEFRSIAKQCNFGPLYGVGWVGLAELIELYAGRRVNKTQAIEYLDGFGKAYPEYPIWQDAVLVYAEKLGYVETYAGRRRRLPDLKSKEWGFKARAQRQAVNAIVQGSAADIMMWANNKVFRLIKSDPVTFDGVRCIGQVHDELAVEGTKKQLTILEPKIKTIMKQAGEHFGMWIPLDVDGGIGKNWTEAK